jgi:HEAT repeat protein
VALAGLTAALGALATRRGDDGDLHRRLQEARLEAELSCGRPTFLASEPPDPDSLVRVDWAGLVETVVDGAPHERWRAIEILGEFGDARAVPALLGALADPRGTLALRTYLMGWKAYFRLTEVRPCLAAQSLGRLGDPRAVDALIAAAGQRENEDLRLCAIKSLGLLRAERAVPVLADAVHRGEMLVAASHALARIATPEGAEAVVSAARDPVRAPWVVDALGEFGLESAAPELRRLMAARELGVGTRGKAREGLWKLRVLLDGDRERSLVRVLGSGDTPERRAWAAWRPGDEGLHGSADALAEALGDPSERVRLAAAAALLRFGRSGEESLLARVAAPGEAGRLAVAALGLVGTERSLDLLERVDEPVELERLAQRSLRWVRLRGAARPLRIVSAPSPAS